MLVQGLQSHSPCMLVSGTFYTASTGSAGKRKEEDEDEEEEEEKEEWFEVGKVPATLQVG